MLRTLRAVPKMYRPEAEFAKTIRRIKGRRAQNSGMNGGIGCEISA
jgi:hypothetical protein